ncbi:MAG: hypothetical protein ABIR77_02960 [Sphingomicrobium sp.]
MLRFMSILLLAAIAIPAVAAPSAPVTMTRDGVTYRYTSEVKGKLIVIHGEQLDTGQTIDLIVDSQGRVDGTVGASPVSFTVSKDSRDRIMSTLAAVAPDAQLATIR